MKRCEAPWPHVELDEWLVPETARLIADNWPTRGWKWLTHSDVVKPDGTSLRKYQPIGHSFPGLYLAGIEKLFDLAIATYPQFLLIEDSPGYFIRRHTDCAGKVISAQVYLPDEGAPETQGVILCDRLGGKAKQIPYRFNHGYAFKVTNNSWHRVLKSETRRRSLQIIYYDTPTPRI